MLLSILGFLVMLAPLVIVHELGHFLFAKLFNVKAEAFSIGFGPRVWKRKIGETEWRVSLIPLGGYVKLLGEDPDAPLSPEDAKRSLQKQAPWKRFFIFSGGPIFNFLWAILVYMTIILIGEPQMASYVGRVLPGSAAQKAGFISGDHIDAIDGAPVKKYEEVSAKIDAKPAQPMTFQVTRKKNPIESGTTAATIQITPTLQDGFSVYGEATRIGEIEGLFPAPRAMTVGISNLELPAAKQSLRTGDTITKLNGHPIGSWEDFEIAYSLFSPGSAMDLEFKSKNSPEKTAVAHFSKPQKSTSLGNDFGLYSSELFIERTLEKSPALEGGLLPGDRIVKVAGTEVHTFFQLKDLVQKSGEKDGKVKIVWERDGKIMEASLSPTVTTNRDALLKKSTQYTIGIVPSLNFGDSPTLIDRVFNPITLVSQGTMRMVTFTYRNFVSIKKMFTGDVSLATLGGPILIANIAGESLSRGLIAFLGTMAILSIGLGVLNILPVPVLDGGHILLLFVEVVRGRPLSMKQLEVVQTMGLSLIALLMFVVIKNDLSRLPFFN